MTFRLSFFFFLFAITINTTMNILMHPYLTVFLWVYSAVGQNSKMTCNDLHLCIICAPLSGWNLRLCWDSHHYILLWQKGDSSGWAWPNQTSFWKAEGFLSLANHRRGRQRDAFRQPGRKQISMLWITHGATWQGTASSLYKLRAVPCQQLAGKRRP